MPASIIPCRHHGFVASPRVPSWTKGVEGHGEKLQPPPQPQPQPLRLPAWHLLRPVPLTRCRRGARGAAPDQRARSCGPRGVELAPPNLLMRRCAIGRPLRVRRRGRTTSNLHQPAMANLTKHWPFVAAISFVVGDRQILFGIRLTVCSFSCRWASLLPAALPPFILQSKF